MKLSAEIDRIVPPGAIERMTGTRPDGLPDGVHTGGTWLTDCDEVWKPLDARPWPGADCRVTTDEDKALEALADLPLFPRNWRVEEYNGRRFLVRQKALVVGQDLETEYINRDRALEIERAVIEVNRRGWLLNDVILPAYDTKMRTLFLLDLSSAQRVGNMRHNDDEAWRVAKFFEWAGHPRLQKTRQNAREAIADLDFMAEHGRGWNYVYASFYRPFSLLWASLPGEFALIQRERADWTEQMPHTWIATKKPLPPNVLGRYELELGWERYLQDAQS